MTRADEIALLSAVSGLPREKIIAGNFVLSPAQAAVFRALAARRDAGEPLAYILGRREFMSLDFFVDASVLIPRQETELLVETALAFCEKREGGRILDIGTGSGCAAVSLCRYLPAGWTAVGLDISEAALSVAQKNAERHGVGNRASFRRADVFAAEFPFGLGEEFDAAVSNPPYIPSGVIDSLQIEVKGFEPRSALDGGEDGLDFYKRIISVSPVREGGLLAFEAGIGQARAIAALAEESGKFHVESVLEDLSGIERVVALRRV